MNDCYVYILECSDKSYYTGVTKNLEYRFEQHQAGAFPKCYTYNRRPLKIVFQQRFDNYLDAIINERRIKKWTRAKKLALITGDIDLLINLSNRKSPSTSSG